MVPTRIDARCLKIIAALSRRGQQGRLSQMVAGGSLLDGEEILSQAG